MSERNGGSARELAQRLAAHLAHLLNVKRNGIVAWSAYEMYDRIVGLLGRRSLGPDMGAYDRLIGLAVLPDRTPDEAAVLFCDHVLDRPLFLARDLELHMAHRLFGSLCRRGLHDSWQCSELVRSHSDFVPIGAAPDDFPAVSRQLDSLPQSMSEGNPAKSRQAHAGRLYLRMPGAAHRVAEEMSVWGAIQSGPPRLRHLAQAEEFNAFCSRMIKAVEQANAHYATLISLGLSPVDWMDEIGVHTAKKALAFLSQVRRIAGKAASEFESLERWREAWRTHQVPGFDTADELFQSELGKALRGHSRFARQDDFDLDTVEDADAAEREEQMLDRIAREQMIVTAERAGVIDALDADLLRRLSAGASPEALGSEAEIARRLDGETVRERLNGIARRIRAHARKKAKRPLEPV